MSFIKISNLFTGLKDKKGCIIRRVTYQETDQMGVVHHANYVSWFEVARTEWMRTIGIAYSKVEESGLMLPLRNLEVNYHKAAHYDQEVHVYTWIDSFSSILLTFRYEVRTVPVQENILENEVAGDLLVSGTTTHIWVDKNWKATRIDRTAPEVLNIIKSYGPDPKVEVKS